MQLTEFQLTMFQTLQVLLKRFKERSFLTIDSRLDVSDCI